MSREFRLGLLILVAATILVVGIQYLKGNYIFDGKRVFYGVYDKVSGLTVSNAVNYNGLRIGQIRDIQLSANDPGKIVVTLAIDNDDFQFSKDSKASIESSLIGEASVSIIPGTNGDIAMDGDTLGIRISKGLTETVYSEIEPIKAKSLELIGSVDSLLTMTRSIIDEDARPHLSESFESMASGLKALESSAQRLDGLMASERQKLSGIFTNLQTITDAFANNSGQLGDVIQNFAQISDSFE